jgi:putative DNA primase/helicase
VSEAKGATPQEWTHFDLELELAGNLLPCVPASPDVSVVPGSALEGKVGKIPSAFNAQGLAHGIREWQKREILPNELAIWRKDPRLNMCVRTGEISGVYALDVDVNDAEKAPTILRIIDTFMGRAPRRTRSNSFKFLIPFRMAEGCKKLIIKLDGKPKGPKIEMLGSGQQFVACGTHESGTRYEWPDGLPSTLPWLTLTQLNTMWSALNDRFALDKSMNTPIISQEPIPATPSTGDQSVQTTISDADWEQLRAALRYMLDKVPDNDGWSSIGYALLSLQRSDKPARELWLQFSRKAVGYEPGAPEAWWDAHYQQIPRSDYRHIFTIARGHGWGRASDPASFNPVPSAVSSSDGLDSALNVEPSAAPERPYLRITGSSLSENVTQLDEILSPHTYAQGNVLVRLTRDRTTVRRDDLLNRDGEKGRIVDVDGIERAADQTTTVPATVGWVRVFTPKICDFLTFDKRKANAEWHLCNCPAELVETWITQGDWPTMRPLEAITRAPFVRPDGSICDTAGYDYRARALYIPTIEYPPLPVDPGEAEARAALERLLHPFDEFPWSDPASRSAFAAHILTEAARIAVVTSPMFWYTAPTAGTGKSLLSVMPSLIVHGNEPAMRPWVVEGEELRKTLFASLLAGDRSIAFDNVPNGYKARAPELCAFLTSAIWQDRKLGVSETQAVPNRAVVSASGNNCTPVSDLARRSVVVRIDANSETMKQRRFKIPNLRDWVLERRSQMLVDALTIIKAYQTVTPMTGVLLPSFERWSRMCRDPLLWLGLPDPCDTQSETDDETVSIGAVFARLAAAFGPRLFTGMDIAKLAGSIADSDGELTALMLQSGCTEPNSPLKIGYWLREQRDKLGAGYKLVSGERGTHGVRWQLRPISKNRDLA